MKQILYVVTIILSILLYACEQNISTPIAEKKYITLDTVYSFIPGEGQNAGQSTEYYPKNILGEPSANATENFPENSPNAILSIGLNGEIIIGFKDYYIIDKDGVDFIIFENAFKNPVNNKIFAEPAIVSVSSDGIIFTEFPYDSTTLDGCAGTIPSIWNKNKLLESGGNHFDLNNIGMSKITHIKIKDISQMVLNNPNHDFYDQVISGFDLDAVIGINFEKK